MMNNARVTIEILYILRWTPYEKASNQCELNCMPRGERFFYRHRALVVDGTKCGEEAVCVNGKCMVSLGAALWDQFARGRCETLFHFGGILRFFQLRGKLRYVGHFEIFNPGAF